MATKAPNHGPRLSGPEYDRKVVALHEGVPEEPSSAERVQLRRAEFELMVNRRLGKRFPIERREALWAIQEQVERKRLRVAFRRLLGGLRSAPAERGATKIASYLEREYASVLTPEEMQAFFSDGDTD